MAQKPRSETLASGKSVVASMSAVVHVAVAGLSANGDAVSACYQPGSAAAHADPVVVMMMMLGSAHAGPLGPVHNVFVEVTQLQRRHPELASKSNLRHDSPRVRSDC